MELFEFPFHAMGCPCELRFYADTKQIAEHAARECIAEANRFESKYSRYLEDSVTTCINSAAGVGPIKIDQETRAILNYAHVCHEQSHGLFDITSGVLRNVWNSQRRSLPRDSELQAILELVGWNKVELTDDTVYLPIRGMELDFGGVVKEYVADALTLMARSMAIEYGLVNLGGDISIVGPQVNGKPWPVGIVHPRVPDTAIAVIALSSGAITTSGGYERYFDIGNQRYSHLINPKTGWPVEGLLSVSVVADKAIVAGSISSIAMLNSELEGLAWLASCDSAYLAIDCALGCHGNLVNSVETSIA